MAPTGMIKGRGIDFMEKCEIIEEMRRELFPSAVEQEGYGRYCDHTVLRAYTTRETVKKFCEEAICYQAAAVCVNPIHVAYVHELLKGTGLRTCTVIGFPLGANMPAVKAMEARLAVEDGADEIDMVINIGALREKDYRLVLQDIKGVVAAAGCAQVKVIIETCYLTDREIVAASLLAQKAGADYVKTSTGFGPDGAREQDVRLIRETVGDSMKIKASTNINTREDAVRMIKAGACRLGTSRTPQIVTGDKTIHSASMENQPPKRE